MNGLTTSTERWKTASKVFRLIDKELERVYSLRIDEVIYQGSGIVSVGKILNNWLIKDFTDYNEPITIQNA
jgi:hypothetical protein